MVTPPKSNLYHQIFGVVATKEDEAAEMEQCKNPRTTGQKSKTQRLG